MFGVYPDELISLTNHIRKRQVDNWFIQIRIASHHATDESQQKKFVEELINLRKDLHGVSENNNPLDQESIEDLKSFLNKTSSMVGAQKVVK